MSLPVAVETLKERFLTNVKVIERLADEKRSLEDYVEELETALHCRSFQPWWEYTKQGTPRSPRSPRSARLARDYREMRTPRSARSAVSAVQSPRSGAPKPLLSASAAADLFEKPKSKSGKSVGLSKHLLADNDRHLQKIAFLDKKERDARVDEERRVAAVEQQRQAALTDKKGGTFKGLEKRAVAAKEKSDRRVAEQRQLAEAAEKEAEQERRRHKQEMINSRNDITPISWDQIQSNEDVVRRERMENRKMKIYAESAAPGAAKPLAPKPAPPVLQNNFVAQDPKQVRRLMQRQPRGRVSSQTPSSSSGAGAAGGGFQATVTVTSAHDKKAARLASDEMRELAAMRRALLEEKSKIERLFSHALPVDSTRARQFNASHLRDKENHPQQQSGAKEMAVSVGKSSDASHRRESHSKKRDEDRYGGDEGKDDRVEFNAKARDDAPSASRPKAKIAQQPSRSHLTLMERHERQVVHEKSADVALGFVKG